MADKKKKKSNEDPYTSRNEFKEGFYNQPGDRPITPETYYGTASGKTMFEPEIMSPDDSMLVEYRQRGGKIKLNKKPKKAFMGLAVQASKNPMSLIGLASKNPMSLIGGANKLLKRSKTARDVTGKLGVGGKLISNYYNDKESDKQSVQPSKEEPTFKQLKGGGFIAKGCGKVMKDKKKVTKMY
jgi:hypothetical protein